MFPGSVTVGSSDFDLYEGDSITYDSATLHWWSNPTAEPALVIGAVTPPSF